MVWVQLCCLWQGVEGETLGSPRSGLCQPSLASLKTASRAGPAPGSQQGTWGLPSLSWMEDAKRPSRSCPPLPPGLIFHAGPRAPVGCIVRQRRDMPLGMGGSINARDTGRPGTASPCLGCTGRMRAMAWHCWGHNLPSLWEHPGPQRAYWDRLHQPPSHVELPSWVELPPNHTERVGSPGGRARTCCPWLRSQSLVRQLCQGNGLFPSAHSLPRNRQRPSGGQGTRQPGLGGLISRARKMKKHQKDT